MNAVFGNLKTREAVEETSVGIARQVAYPNLGRSCWNCLLEPIRSIMRLGLSEITLSLTVDPRYTSPVDPGRSTLLNHDITRVLTYTVLRAPDVFHIFFVEIHPHSQPASPDQPGADDGMHGLGRPSPSDVTDMQC